MEPSLPMPPQEAQPNSVAPEQHTGGYSAESQPSRPERLGELNVQPLPQPLPTPQMNDPQSLPSTAISNIPADDDSPQIADDVDVIEKEWVDKAKKIVDSTKNDPRQQEEQVSRLQADYMLKRYNKQIKTTE